MKWLRYALVVFGISLSTILWARGESKGGREILVTEPAVNEYTYLVSSGSSGNTWLRYCLEYLTKRPTLKFRREYRKLDKFYLDTETQTMKLPINNTVALDVDYTKPPIFKIHSLRIEGPTKFTNPSNAIFVLLLRNPKECLLKYHKNFQNLNQVLSRADHYFYTNLIDFDNWDPKKRKVVYYEDLILNPEQTLKSLLHFLGESDQHLAEFMKEFAKHKQQSIDFYKFTNHTSASKGNSILFHSLKLSEEEKHAIDLTIQKTHPVLWQKYLSRYAEGKK